MFHVEQIFPREEEKRVAKIVAIANQKGGVGKTTTAVNLSSCVAALGKKVLIVDLDPQGNTTTGYGIPKRSVEAGTYEVLIGRATAAQAIGCKELYGWMDGAETLDAALEKLKQSTRRYAKRQLTWFGADKRIHWIEPDTQEEGETPLDRAMKLLEKEGTG